MTAGVSGIRIRHVKSGAETALEAKGVFIAIGHTPNTGLFRGSAGDEQRLHRCQQRLDGQRHRHQRAGGVRRRAMSPIRSTGRL